jgi:hypothetical protein
MSRWCAEDVVARHLGEAHDAPAVRLREAVGGGGIAERDGLVGVPLRRRLPMTNQAWCASTHTPGSGWSQLLARAMSLT